MRILFASILLLVISSIAFAQDSDRVLTRVKYSFTHIQDTTKKNQPYTENMVLLVGKNASLYISYDKVNQIIEGRKQQEKMKLQAGTGTLTFKGYKMSSQTDYYYFIKENKFFTKERLVSDYLIEEEAPKINWKITKETRNFSGVHCQKATANFKGRNWIVWFAPDMPFQSGPWKLNGLPGIIIDAYDQSGTVKFQFTGIEDTSVATDNLALYSGNEVKLPLKIMKASLKDMEKLKDAYAKDPQGFMKTQSGGGSSMVITGYSTSPSAPIAEKDRFVFNNPLELPEKNK